MLLISGLYQDNFQITLTLFFFKNGRNLPQLGFKCQWITGSLSIKPSKCQWIHKFNALVVLQYGNAIKFLILKWFCFPSKKNKLTILYLQFTPREIENSKLLLFLNLKQFEYVISLPKKWNAFNSYLMHVKIVNKINQF